VPTMAPVEPVDAGPAPETTLASSVADVFATI
jgi:hypothetical protein